MKRKLFILTFCTLLVIGLGFYWRTRAFVEQVFYNFCFENEPIANKKVLEKILSDFEIIDVQNLPKSTLEASKMNVLPYREMVASCKFYKLKKKDVYRKIAGNIRIKDLISKDAAYRNSSYFSDTTLYWGIDKRILFKLLELQQTLKTHGYNPNGFWVSTGHRTPAFNEALNGASKSRHILGEAVDLTIGDVDGNGHYTEADKNIVLELCEKEIIKNEGGIGRYPGTRVVHIDVRGYRARWDKY